MSMEFPGKLESSNLSSEILSREIGRTSVFISMCISLRLKFVSAEVLSDRLHTDMFTSAPQRCTRVGAQYAYDI